MTSFEITYHVNGQRSSLRAQATGSAVTLITDRRRLYGISPAEARTAAHEEVTEAMAGAEDNDATWGLRVSANGLETKLGEWPPSVLPDDEHISSNPTPKLRPGQQALSAIRPHS